MEIIKYEYFDREEIYSLYNAVGWTAYTDKLDELENGFKNSLLVMAAYEEETLIGIIRVVGDGYTIVFIQDILVLPEYQDQGVGSKLLKAVIDYYPDVYQIQLTTDATDKTIKFYESTGFKELSSIGCCGFMKI